MLPGLDVRGRRMFMARNGVANPHIFPANVLIKAVFMILDLYMEEDEILSIVGSSHLSDVINVTSEHMMIFSPDVVRKSTSIWQDGYPLRPQGFHYINTPLAFETLFPAIKAFLNDKMKRKVRHNIMLSTLNIFIIDLIDPSSW